MVCKASWKNSVKNLGNMTSCAYLIIMFPNMENMAQTEVSYFIDTAKRL